MKLEASFGQVVVEKQRARKRDKFAFILRSCHFPENIVIRKRIQLTMQLLAKLHYFPEKK